MSQEPAAIRRTADSGPSRRRRAPAGVATHIAGVGKYLTDEVFLYRVVDVLVTGAGEMADLEDCYWLDVVRVPISDVLERRLRVVTPT